MGRGRDQNSPQSENVNTMKVLWTLHGFLGTTLDWSFLGSQLSAGFQVKHINLWNYARKNFTFEDCTRALHEEVSSIQAKHYFIAYSLGGRLALHCSLKHPDLFEKMIFVSTHTGLDSAEEQKKRIEKDHHWSLRFENDPWSEVMANWNAQDVFNGSDTPPVRAELDFNRSALSWALNQWSLGRQKNLSTELSTISHRSLWMVGEKDEKFKALGEKLKRRLPQMKLEVVKQSGHRIPMEAPGILLKNMETFLAE